MIARRRPVAVCAVVALVAVLLAACGEQGPAPRSMAAVLDTFVTSAAVEEQCSRAVTPRFVRDVYGGSIACERARISMPERGLAAFAAMSVMSTTTVRVRGNRAAVTVTLGGSDGTIVRGRVGLERDDSGWRVDDLGSVLLRELYQSEALAMARRGAHRPGQLARARACIASRVTRRSDLQIWALYLPASVGESLDARVRRAMDVGTCLHATGR